ncbi:MAG: hypothetical protein IH591_18485 [Bacteroidales bacterium]|nr:hypothetical protein [Bacteroidales bacterium]
MSLTGNRDFTVAMYRKLLLALKESGYAFQTFEEYSLSPGKKIVIMRHDVDRRAQNALRLAEIESEMGIKGSYHFRAVRSSNVPEIIRHIAGLGHEIAYHYEDMSLAAKMAVKALSRPEEELAARAFESFRANLAYFRTFYPVRVISMHGSPAKRIDNRLVWKYFDYHECDIVCEPYFDLDYSDMLYLTDTGRRWNGERYNIRDKALTGGSNRGDMGISTWKVKPVSGSLLNMTNDALELSVRYKIHSTKEIISLAGSGALPDKLVINTHPQRWNDALFPWINELLLQFIKNQLKRSIIKYKGRKTIN